MITIKTMLLIGLRVILSESDREHVLTFFAKMDDAHEVSQIGVNQYENTSKTDVKLSLFDRFLFFWVALAMGLGVILGYFVPSMASELEKASVAQISIPSTILIWLMIFPMMLNVDVSKFRQVWKRPRALIITTSINYLIQPFAMFAFSLLFFRVIYSSLLSVETQNEYIAGSVLLGGAPCTAMVFVWSQLVNGDPEYTVIQVVVNDILIFIFYIPTVMLLLGVSNIPIPWLTVVLSVLLFLVLPFAGGWLARYLIVKHKGAQWLTDVLLPHLTPVSHVSLLLTIVFIFIFQADAIINQPIAVLLIAVPQILQTVVIFAITYTTMYFANVPFEIAAPGALIATSNFFELAVAIAISLFGLGSGATLATVVGVLEEVPLMLSLVWFCKRTKNWFPRHKSQSNGNHMELASTSSDTPV